MSHGRKNVTFTNATRDKIFVAYMRLDHACGADCGEPWDVLGWIGLDPGETETRSNPTKNQWMGYYAESTSGAVWAGPFVNEVSQDKFDKCTCLGVSVSHGPQPYHDVGFRDLDTAQFSGVRFVS